MANTSKTKIFFDTEFTGLHQGTTLISIGLVSECGKKFYAEFTDYDKSQVNNWIQENVIDNLLYNEYRDNGIIICDLHFNFEMKANIESVKEQLTNWLNQFHSVEMWGDCLAYDWVLFCQLFGHAFNIPANVHYIPYDLSTLFRLKYINPDVNREEYSDIKTNHKKHNALFDALVIQACYLKAIRL